MMFVDNPIGTGFSYINTSETYYRTNENDVANDFVQFLLNFYSSSLYSNYSNTPLYIFGESYAGHYIPNIANAIITHNAQKGAV